MKTTLFRKTRGERRMCRRIILTAHIECNLNSGKWAVVFRIGRKTTRFPLETQHESAAREYAALMLRKAAEGMLRRAGSREQGAGSREQGAGSREQGAGSRAALI